MNRKHFTILLLLFILPFAPWVYAMGSSDNIELPTDNNSPNLRSKVKATSDYDVSDVFVQGDSTLMNMRIESSYFAKGAFLIETTGARFEYVKGRLKIYQGLDGSNRRLLSAITFDNEPNFVKAKVNNDHILFWSENVNLGIYGDSTCIVSPKKIQQQLKCRGSFRPDYEGRYQGELLLIDEQGGMEIYPQRYEGGYEIRKIELGKKDWIVDYELNVGERVMIAAFPGKEFDWEKSFKSNVAFTSGSNGKRVGEPYGKMPSDWTIRRWSTNFNAIVIWCKGLYRVADYSGPYVVANEPEFRRLVKTAQESGMKVAVYCSLFYHYYKFRNIELFFEQLKKLRQGYGIDGVYVDGLTVDYWIKIDNKILNWEMIRRLRELFGSDGFILLHGTHRGGPTATVPNVDSYCDVTLYGEGVAFDSVDDPYVRYQVRKYGISNSVAMWKPGPHPGSITDNEIIDAILAMNGRERYWVTDIRLSDRYKYYLERLETMKRACFESRSAP
jgi:hypothetical protein